MHAFAQLKDKKDYVVCLQWDRWKSGPMEVEDAMSLVWTNWCIADYPIHLGRVRDPTDPPGAWMAEDAKEQGAMCLGLLLFSARVTL